MYALRQIKKTVAAILMVSISSQMVVAMPPHQGEPADVLFFSPLKVEGAKALLAPYNNISFVPKAVSGVAQKLLRAQGDQILPELTFSAVAGAMVGSLSSAVGWPVLAEPLVGTLMASGNSCFAERLVVGGVSTEVMRFVLGQRPLMQVVLDLLTYKEEGNVDGAFKAQWDEIGKGFQEKDKDFLVIAQRAGESAVTHFWSRSQKSVVENVVFSTLSKSGKGMYIQGYINGFRAALPNVWCKERLEKVRKKAVLDIAFMRAAVTLAAASGLAVATAAAASGFAAIMAADSGAEGSTPQMFESQTTSSATLSRLSLSPSNKKFLLSFLKPAAVGLKGVYDQNKGHVSGVAVALKEAADDYKDIAIEAVCAFKGVLDKHMGGPSRAALAVAAVLLSATVTGEFFAWGVWSAVTFLVVPIVTATVKVVVEHGHPMV